MSVGKKPKPTTKRPSKPPSQNKHTNGWTKYVENIINESNITSNYNMLNVFYNCRFIS